MTDPAGQRPAIAKIFYECDAIGASVPGSAPTALDTNSAVALAKKFLTSAEPSDFFGFIDDHDNALQMYLEESGNVWLEVPAPDLQGAHGASITSEQAVSLIEALPSKFGPTTVPGAQLRTW